jgi:hypothetical protein
MRKITPKQDEYSVAGPVRGTLTKKKAPPVYPKVRISLEHLPEAKNMKLGEHAHIKIHGKLVGLNQGGYDNSAEFEMHGIEHHKMHKNDDEEENESEAERKREAKNPKLEGEEEDNA